jgi:alpha-tubulin suppressor-like RCC1 family protein
MQRPSPGRSAMLTSTALALMALTSAVITPSASRDAAALAVPLLRASAAPTIHGDHGRRHAGQVGRVTHIVGRERWSADAIVALDGPVVVDAGGTLVIDAGTRVEGAVGSYIFIARDGLLDARGTLFDPIQLTCAAAAKYPGCWGGVIMHGFARINAGTLTSPASTTRSPAGNCLEEPDPVAGGQRFGGCNDADNSGTLRFVRIEYAERGLHLAGVGSGTEVHHVQSNRSRNEGVLATGGMVDVAYLFLTANGTGLRWTGGWRGRGQYIAVQQDVLRFAAGVVGQNGTTTSAAAADALPRSAPVLFNLTVIAQSVPANPNHGTARAIVLERGTAGVVRNLFLYAPQIGLDLGGAATCSELTSGALQLQNVLTAGATALGEGLVPSNCGTTEAALLASVPNNNGVLPGVLGLLVSTNDLFLPDLRPVARSPLALGQAGTPPSTGFFTGGVFLGAVPPLVVGAQMAIPWFSGWTVPAPPPAPIPEGIIRGVVTSPFRGALSGVRVTEQTSGESVVTSSTGAYQLRLPAGTALLDVSVLPSACSAPATRAGTVFPEDTTTLNLAVDCAPLPGTERIGVGDAFACGIADQGTFCWGNNTYGQLGNGTTTASLLPSAVTVSFSSLSVGARHVCAREPGGAVRCWGDGAQGQLGDGTGISRALPTAGVGGPFEMVTAGGSHSCALTTTGEARCWGANTLGQLGNGTTVSALSPVTVAAGRIFSTIAAGRDHTCALDLTGRAWCWGSNAHGQLGDGTTIDRSAPVAVAGTHVFAALAGGGDAHTCATGATGTVRCWGANAAGQLGNGSTASSAVPVPVTFGSALSQLTLGDQHSCAITADGTSHCWGAGTDGQIGDGFTVARPTPTPASANARFNRMTGGTAVTCAVTFGAVTGEDNEIIFSRRSLLCWGRNTSGEFGRGTTLSTTTPTVAATGLTFP